MWRIVTHTGALRSVRDSARFLMMSVPSQNLPSQNSSRYKISFIHRNSSFMDSCHSHRGNWLNARVAQALTMSPDTLAPKSLLVVSHHFSFPYKVQLSSVSSEFHDIVFVSRPPTGAGA